MTEEQNKDVRLMLDMIAKDLKRLSDDVKCLSQFLDPKFCKEQNDDNKDPYDKSILTFY